MNKTAIRKEVFRSERFRTPRGVELELGLWVDRIGQGRQRRPHAEPGKLRMLGLHAAVGILSGCGTFESGAAGRLKAEPGDAILLFPGEPAIYWPDEEWQERFVVWGGPEADILSGSGILSPRAPLLKGAAGRVSEAYSRISPLMDSECLLAALERKTAVLDLILKLAWTWKKEAGAEPGKELPGSVAKALAALAGAPAPEAGMDALARECGLSPTHFRRLFKRHTGMSPKDYAMSVRISRAKRLLSEGASLKEVSADCGFADVFHFMRTFKKATGSSAAAYAKGLLRS